MNRKQLILEHLTLYQPLPDRVEVTTYVAALRDARGIMKRNPVTGGPDSSGNNGHEGSWLGAIGYLVLLDHIGNCFTLKRKRPTERRSLMKAIELFHPETNRDDRFALYALRCAFAHQYCLHHRPKRREKETPTQKAERRLLRRQFMVTSKGPLVSQPLKPWRGGFAKESNDPRVVTTVNLVKIAELVEIIHRRLVRYAEADKLKIVLPGRSAELARHRLVSPLG